MILLELISNKDKFLNILKEEWLKAEDTFPDFLSEINPETKIINELYIKSISQNLQKQIGSFRKIPIQRGKWRNKALDMIYDILYREDIIGLHHYMNQNEIDSFFGELMEFLRHVRKFAPDLLFTDIGQAIRNYIVYAVFKKLNKETSGFNLAAFGYSMLYPFTDNYLDNKSLSSEDKKEYNQLIRDKIDGKEIHPQKLHHRKTCDLLQNIEDLYPRNLDQTIYQLLLMMLDAQENSLSQQNKDLPLSDQERLEVSIYKGSISVLMDRFFVNKDTTEEDLIFYLSFGFFLQLADDLQDIGEDSRLGHSSLFTTNLQCRQEEAIVNKLLHYVHHIMTEYRSDNESLKHFLLSNSYLLIFTSVIRSREFFSQEYIATIEKFLPFNTSILMNLQNNNVETMDRKLQNKYIKILDALIK